MNSSDQNNPSENNSSRNNKSKKGKGRQKVNMVKIENETNLQVTFSKRRAGLFKKASELSTLCGAESAIVVFSPGEKAHSFGNPSVETIANRFLNQNNNVPPRNEHTEQLLRAHSEANMRQHNQELIHIEAQLELEKKRKQELDNMTKQNHSWCLPNIDELNYQELDQLKRSVMSFKQNFETKVQDATNLVNSSYVQEPNHETGFPLDSHFQGSNQIALFEAGASSSNLGFPTNPGGNSSGISFFPDYMNSSSGVNVSPFDPMNGNNFGMTVQYPHLATNSDGILPYNYRNPNDIVPYGIGTRNNELEHETHNNGQNKWQGSSSNYGRRGI